MKRPSRKLTLAAALLGLLAAELSPAEAQRRYRPVGTEMSRAISRCRVAVIGGTLLGGVVGALIGGRRNRGGGAVLGAVGGNLAGGLVCAIMMHNAERQDAIIAAQMAAAAGTPGTPYNHAIGDGGDGKGAALQLISRVEDVTPAGQLVQVRYPVAGGGEQVSPELGGGQRWCRRVSSEAVMEGQSAALPGQLFCRDENHNWAPYAERGARST